MNRVKKNKLVFTLFLLFYGVFSFLLFYLTKSFLISVFFLVLLFLPGRILASAWENFFNGKIHMTNKDLDKAIDSFHTFLKDLDKKPGLKNLEWLIFGLYTKDAEAMTFNNLGSAFLQKKELETAEQYFQKAAEKDPLYPIPYFNLAILKALKKNKEESETFFNKAVFLGYKKSNFESFYKKIP
ncbi:MAG: hypothetical protein H7A25_15515 [Leptospiraceae bacterium]|nr:hypothetical protein [Leptospiraceae bacterium]